MANMITKTVKKTAKKTGKKVVKSSVNYAKGYITKGIVCWLIAAAIAALPQVTGFALPAWMTGADTIGMIGFVVAGFLCFGRKLSVGRCVALFRTFLQ